MLKNYLKSYIYLITIILILTLILSITSYLITINSNIIKLLIPIISLFISTIILGKNTKESAYLEGIKFSLPYILLSIIMSFIFKNPLTIKLFVSYILLLLSGIIGAMIGINLKNNHN